jgi:xylose isomerase
MQAKQETENRYRLGACLPVFGSCADRYCLSGYGRGASTLEGMLDLAAQCPGLQGVELVGNWHIHDDNIGSMPKELSDRGLAACMLTADLWTQAKWARGSLAAPDAPTRAAAVAECRKVIEWAEAMGNLFVDLWFGQDGYDYPFQSDYESAWQWLVEGVRAAAAHRPNVPVCIEYKLKEPRTHIHVNSAAKTLLLIDAVGAGNLGALLDTGHALAAGENAAEAAALLHGNGRKRLFYVHLNDNYGLWDDDMIVGSVRVIELMEFLYWLRRLDYRGWLTLDVFPYREEGLQAARESFAWIADLLRIIEEAGPEDIERVLQAGDGAESVRLARRLLTGGNYT